MSPSAELETSVNATQTHHPESFSGQFRQRKRARTHKEQDKREKDLIDNPVTQGTQMPRKRHTQKEKQSWHCRGLFGEVKSMDQRSNEINLFPT